jgi:hypothetical protein
VANSSNPALCLRDYLTNSRYGKGLATGFIDDTLFNAAANKCDALITPYLGGGQQKIFTCSVTKAKAVINLIIVKTLKVFFVFPLILIRSGNGHCEE